MIKRKRRAGSRASVSELADNKGTPAQQQTTHGFKNNNSDNNNNHMVNTIGAPQRGGFGDGGRRELAPRPREKKFQVLVVAFSHAGLFRSLASPVQVPKSQNSPLIGCRVSVESCNVVVYLCA